MHCDVLHAKASIPCASPARRFRQRPTSRHIQRGSVYLSYALLAFVIALIGVLLVPVHKAFALLVPVGVLVFFWPNLMMLTQWCCAAWHFARQLAALRGGPHKSAVILTNEFHGFRAQALWLDPASRELGLVPSEGKLPVQTLDTLQKVRGAFVEESDAVSFHEGQIRIPACFILAFEFNDGSALKVITRKQRRFAHWVAAVHPHVGELLVLDGIDGVDSVNK